MISVAFKNLEPSDLARTSAHERMAVLVDKFPELNNHRIRITLEMENAPNKRGADSFSVTVRIQGTKYRNIMVRRDNIQLYPALAKVMDSLLETLNRSGDRVRVTDRAAERSVERSLGNLSLEPSKAS
jgi:ribosome-associated translation inhibitor RaiA